jgi:hypothetical protein
VALYEEVKERLRHVGAELLHLTTSFRSPPSIQSFVNLAFAPAMAADTEGSQAGYVRLEPSRPEIIGRPTLIARSAVADRQAEVRRDGLRPAEGRVELLRAAGIRIAARHRAEVQGALHPRRRVHVLGRLRHQLGGHEAMIPLNSASGHGIGVVGELHFFFDDIFPNTLGKPIFTGGL